MIIKKKKSTFSIGRWIKGKADCHNDKVGCQEYWKDFHLDLQLQNISGLDFNSSEDFREHPNVLTCLSHLLQMRHFKMCLLAPNNTMQSYWSIM